MFSNKFRYAILILSLLLILFKLFTEDFSSIGWKDSFGYISPILLILAMIVSIKHVNREQNKTN